MYSHNKEIGEWHNLQKVQLESAKSVTKKSFGWNDETTEGLNMAQTLVVLLLPPPRPQRLCPVFLLMTHSTFRSTLMLSHAENCF